MTDNDEVYNVVRDLVEKTPAPDGMESEDVQDILKILREHMFDEDRKKVQKKIMNILESCANKAYSERGEK
jgi:hypothetical protein